MRKDNLVLIMTLAILLVLIGAKLNFTVMIDNDGRMPLQWDFYSLDVDEYVLWDERAQVKLWWLGDNFKLWFIVFSLGDILIFVGILLAIAVNIKNIHNIKRGRKKK